MRKNSNWILYRFNVIWERPQVACPSAKKIHKFLIEHSSCIVKHNTLITGFRNLTAHTVWGDLVELHASIYLYSFSSIFSFNAESQSQSYGNMNKCTATKWSFYILLSVRLESQMFYMQNVVVANGNWRSLNWSNSVITVEKMFAISFNRLTYMN